MERDDFREAAKSLKGSRDVGAQLFCSLLRAAGVEARLVCSLQPLSFAPGAPALPKPKVRKTPSKSAAPSQIPSIYQDGQADESPITATSSPRRRLGHPQATAYNVPSLASPSRSPSVSRHHEVPKRILLESPFPINWVEVLDVAHQRWQPVDPLVSQTQWKPAKLEPPASDRDTALAYAIAFAGGGTARGGRQAGRRGEGARAAAGG